ncbi:hypothetical protein SAMN06269185_2528 [Natronoarchaeum philippinense]|uniref:Uncharacterized protein n=1 Tax=Natronoarchaeum philippinense TaxID=558529 RepID=A0A285P6V5_NATPI|nr:hypothetical protein [Natronoarchaeum philippinense]SNZ15601.1 hypothetical protein SAMN06269185_2528 [Natronoarchaeum philippinense]
MDDDELPTDWARDERYDRLARRSGRDPTYEGYVHDTGDVRLHVAMPDADAGEPGAYTIFLTLYPYTELATQTEVRTVTTAARADEVVSTFADLFVGACDGPSDVEAAAEYALERTRPANVTDTSLVNDSE